VNSLNLDQKSLEVANFNLLLDNDLVVLFVVFLVVNLVVFLVVMHLLSFYGFVTLDDDQFFFAFYDIDVFLAEFTSFLDLLSESGGNLLWHVDLNFDGVSNNFGDMSSFNQGFLY
jgi:hypothetical protein